MPVQNSVVLEWKLRKQWSEMVIIHYIMILY